MENLEENTHFFHAKPEKMRTKKKNAKEHEKRESWKEMALSGCKA